jgi:hypothetical protein
MLDFVQPQAAGERVLGLGGEARWRQGRCEFFKINKRPRSFEEVVAATDPAERARIERMETFNFVAPTDAPSMWTLAYGVSHKDRTPMHGYKPMRWPRSRKALRR